MTTLEHIQLATVRGGFDEGQVRQMAQEYCPRTFQHIRQKPMSSMTRADANACLNEWNPNFIMRGLAQSQIDGYFGSRK